MTEENQTPENVEAPKVPTVRLERVSTSVYNTYKPIDAHAGKEVEEYATHAALAKLFDLVNDKFMVDVQKRELIEGVWNRVGSPSAVKDDYRVEEGDVVIFRDKPKKDGK